MSLDPGPPARFELNVLEQSIIGDSGSATLTQRREGSDIVVDVSVSSAKDLKAFYFELGYDTASYSPVAAQATRLLCGTGGTDLLELADLAGDGKVSHGQVLGNWDRREGFSGSGKVAVLRFATGPASGLRTASTPPMDDVDRPALTVNADLSRLSWEYSLKGDYDQNGMVTVGDLTPLGRYYSSPSPYAPGSIESVVDGDDNGLITVGDITPIGRNYEKGVSYYEVFFTSESFQRPENISLEWDALDRVYLEDAIGEPGQQKLMFDIHQPAPAPNGWFWICATHDRIRGPASPSIITGEGEDKNNDNPVAVIYVDSWVGETPMTVNFDASASHDDDGEIVKYEWDWDMSDDNWEWEDHGTSTQTEHTYHFPGIYYAVLRVTDDQGALAWDLMVIPVAQGPNQCPVAVIEADTTETPALHEIHFDASRSFDWDGDIVLYRWDYNSDGLINAEETVPQVQYAYQQPGDYTVTLMVLDDEGALGEASLDITITPNHPPVAVMQAGPLTGSAPLSVTFDPAGTHDPEDELAELEWNLGGNIIRRYLEDGQTLDDLLEPFVQTFYVTGEYECKLRAIDRQGISSESAAQTVTVTGWSSERWDLPNSPVGGDYLELMLIDNRLALIVSGVYNSVRNLYFYMAEDETATNWLEPVMIAADLGNFGGRCDLALIDGLPAVTYLDKINDCIYYCSARDIDGRQWNEPVVIDSGIGDFGGSSALASISGNPAVAWGKGDSARYSRALAADGLGWSAPVTLDSGAILGSPITMLEVDGLAAICYTVGYIDLRYIQLMDLAGTAAYETYDVAGPGWGTSVDFNIFDNGGLPAIMYVGHFLRPLDSSCQSWADAVPTCYGLVNRADPNGQLVSFRGGLVALNQNAGLYICPSKDPDGVEWKSPQLVDDDCDLYNKILGAAVVNDKIYVVYYPFDDPATPEPPHMVCRMIY